MERFRGFSTTQEILPNGKTTTMSSVEDVIPERQPKFHQYQPKNTTAGEDSCDSGDYFLSISKDMKTMKAIPVSEL